MVPLALNLGMSATSFSQRLHSGGSVRRGGSIVVWDDGIESQIFRDTGPPLALGPL